MTERPALLLARATESLAAARRELAAGQGGFAADRAYYAMFYVAEMLLLQKELEFSSHGAVLGAFGKEFASTGEVDPRFHRSLLDAFRTRQMVMYDVTIEISLDAAESLIADATDFLELGRNRERA